MSGEPYTHAMHAQACQQSATDRRSLTAFVQVRSAQTSCCAMIRDAWSTLDGQDFWKLQVVAPFSFTGSYPVKAVRQCSGLDGRCACAGETGLEKAL